MSYYQSTGSPTQLVLCALFQCTTDIAILSQFYFYRKKNQEIAKKIAALEKTEAEKQGKELNATEFLVRTSSAF